MVKLPGRSIKEAFAFGNQYCSAVTASNPPPVQLKLEKVYSSCLLQTVRIIYGVCLNKRSTHSSFVSVFFQKKKYCGMMYESPTQKHPTFEAKGIETVRNMLPLRVAQTSD